MNIYRFTVLESGMDLLQPFALDMLSRYNLNRNSNKNVMIDIENGIVNDKVEQNFLEIDNYKYNYWIQPTRIDFNFLTTTEEVDEMVEKLVLHIKPLLEMSTLFGRIALEKQMPYEMERISALFDIDNSKNVIKGNLSSDKLDFIIDNQQLNYVYGIQIIPEEKKAMKTCEINTRNGEQISTFVENINVITNELKNA